MDDNKVYEILHDIKYNVINKNIEEKYNLILNFVNMFSPQKLTSLIKFHHVNVNDIKNEDVEKALEKYKYKLEGILSIDIDDINIDLTQILSDCLDTIDYSTRKSIDENNECIYISILDKPRKKNYSRPKTPEEIKNMQKKICDIYKEKKKIVLKFVNCFTNNKFRSLKKVEFELNSIDKIEFKKIFTEHKKTLEESLFIKFDDNYNIISIMEKILFSIGYMIKKTREEDNIFISFVEQ